MQPEQAADRLKEIVGRMVEDIRRELPSRSYRTAVEIRNASQEVLRGQRSGRRYRKPHTKVLYTASAPGEPPANRTGLFRISFHEKAWSDRENGTEVYHAAAESRLRAGEEEKSRHLLGEILENGTRRMAPRPYKQRTISLAMPKVMRIYRQRYIK